MITVSLCFVLIILYIQKKTEIEKARISIFITSHRRPLSFKSMYLFLKSSNFVLETLNIFNP